MNFDEIDEKILRFLLSDSRMKKTEIARECGLTSVAIQNRIEVMKENGLIIKPVLSLNLVYFGYPISATIGLNVKLGAEEEIIELINKNTIVAGIDKTFGEYDICFFVFAKNLKDLDRVKNLVLNQTGVNKIDVLIWNDFQLRYDNINLTIKKE
jgi:Lrp/AsnC family transcriptional regulator for asnA, asnC and gidA